MPTAVVQHSIPHGDTFYAAVAPRLCTNPQATEHTLAALLDAEVAANDNCGAAAGFDAMTPFHALEAPTISVAAYVARLSQYAFSSTACLLSAYHYVKRAAAADPSLAPTSLSVHRLLITAVVLAAKYFDDVTYSMGYYAKVGGLPTKELVYLELRMLSLLDFRLHIAPSDFHTLEIDLGASLRYVPRSSSTAAALDSVASAGIAGDRARYCEALHDSDPVGLWRPHPDPSRAMLTSLEAASSPVNSPTGSPRREEEPADTARPTENCTNCCTPSASADGGTAMQVATPPSGGPGPPRGSAPRGTKMVARRGRYLNEDEQKQSQFENIVNSFTR